MLLNMHQGLVGPGLSFTRTAMADWQQEQQQHRQHHPKALLNVTSAEQRGWRLLVQSSQSTVYLELASMEVIKVGAQHSRTCGSESIDEYVFTPPAAARCACECRHAFFAQRLSLCAYLKLDVCICPLPI